MSLTVHGVLWGAVYGALVVAPLLGATILTGPGQAGTGWDFAVALGVAALGLLGSLFLLTARFRRAALPFGVDILYYFHRWVGVLTLVLILLHAAILLALEPGYWRFPGSSGSPVIVSGFVAIVSLTVVSITSLARQRLKIEYDRWRRLHVLFATTGAVATAWHVAAVAGIFALPGLRELFLIMTLSWAGLVLYVRALKPALQWRRPYRVIDVHAERGNAWTVTVQPEGHAGFRFQPGQFAWLTLRASPWALREHPFSIASSAAADGTVAFTIKALGDFTSGIGRVQPGERAWLEGPHGAFTPDRYPGAPLVLVAGGIGIAPIVSMLRTLADRGDRRALRLVYAYRDLDSLTFREELEGLAARLNLSTVRVLREPPPGSGIEAGVLTEDILLRHLPEQCRACHYFVCGPLPMVGIVEAALRRRGVSPRRMHVELFGWV